MQHNDLLGLAFGVRDGLPVITAKSKGKLHELLPGNNESSFADLKVSI